ncbi:MAG: DUF983 domain-containing protein [Flavobacteriales bacterium]|nr:DUF983 domain-containing protein [Flavobacteriales bacterium]
MKFKRSNIILGILRNRCPRCHNGPFWAHANPYVNLIRYKGGIYERCSSCGLKYEKDVGFWYGAMIVSYALNVGLFLIMWALWAWVYDDDTPLLQLVTSIILSSILFFPIVFYLSRMVWIRFFVRYDEKCPSEAGSFPAEVTTR